MSLSLVPDRIYSQYRDKPKFVEWMEIARKLGRPLDRVFEKISLSYDIDSASGELLNIIGRIVGIDRNFINKIELDQVQFGEEDSEFGASDCFFSSDSVANDSLMSDGLFRLIIKAKILKNNRDATIEDIIEQMVLLVGVDFLKINNPENMTFSIEFAGNITPLQRYALFNENIIQIPQGVLFNGFTEINDYVEFGEEDRMFGEIDSMFTAIGA